MPLSDVEEGRCCSKYRDSFSFCFLANSDGSNFPLSIHLLLLLCPPITVTIKFSCKAIIRGKEEEEEEKKKKRNESNYTGTQAD